MRIRTGRNAEHTLYVDETPWTTESEYMRSARRADIMDSIVVVAMIVVCLAVGVILEVIGGAA